MNNNKKRLFKHYTRLMDLPVLAACLPAPSLEVASLASDNETRGKITASVTFALFQTRVR